MKRMMGVLAAAVLTAGLLPGTAIGNVTTASAQCRIALGSVSATGDSQWQDIVAATPPTNAGVQVIGRDLYPDGATRLSTAMVYEPVAGGPRVFGYVVIGSALYRTRYDAYSGGAGTVVPGSVVLQRIGGGWDSFVALQESRYAPYSGSFSRTNEYGLRNDGTLFRWTRDNQGVWRNATSAPGFAAVKSMVLISKTRTYDTFLANTRSGALYTIHIPTTAPMKPVVTKVRGSTWQGFESLVAEKCGSQGTLLVGLDKDTKTAYLYAVGHANGPATVIRALGKLPGTFDAPLYFRWATLDFDDLFGE
ncbi:hypothetical protein AB0E69_26425 [Kribbella sp. NPDC026611]|uniref:hypothetical protein n=1 Tax=Kribbella sp. NPDC026611 TaxID=3154911 RepID=UPI00340627B1